MDYYGLLWIFDGLFMDYYGLLWIDIFDINVFFLLNMQIMEYYGLHLAKKVENGRCRQLDG